MNSRTKRKSTLTNKKNEKGGIVLKVLKGAVAGLIVTIGSVLILAFVIKNSDMSNETISAFNQIIKILSVFIASFIASRGINNKFIAHGALSGVLYVMLGFLAFSIIDGGFGDIKLLLLDLVMAAVIGVMVAFIFGKLIKSKKQTTNKSTKKAY